MSKKKVSKTRDSKRKVVSPAKSAAPKKLIVDAMELFRVEDRARKAALTTDGFDNFVSRLGLNNDNTLSAGTYVFNLVTRNRVKLEAAYRGSWIVGAVIDSFAEDMTRAGIDITTNEGDDDIKDIQAAISRLQLWQSQCSNIKWGDLYGGSLAIIQIKGQKLDTPLDISTIGKDQFTGLAIYDRWQLNPVLQDVIQEGPEMGLPTYYDIVNGLTSVEPNAPTQTGQVRVHHSRVFRYIGIELPFFQAITEMLWGESKLERLWDRLIAFDSVTMSTANLIERANNRTVGIDGLREIIAAGGEAKEGLLSMFDMMRTLQTNEGMTLLDKNDTFTVHNYTFTGLDLVVLLFAQQLSGASGIPLLRLLSQSPAGLNASGDADIRMYYDNVNARQNAKLRTPWDTLLKILWRSVHGKDSPKDLEFKFTPLWQMSETDKATNAKTTTETAIGAFEAGVTDRATTLKELRQSSGDTGMFSNISDEDIEEAENEEPPLPDADPAAPDPATDPSKEPVKNLDAKPKWYRGILDAAGFKESNHPRANNGEFGSGGSVSKLDQAHQKMKSALKEAKRAKSKAAEYNNLLDSKTSDTKLNA